VAGRRAAVSRELAAPPNTSDQAISSSWHGFRNAVPATTRLTCRPLTILAIQNSQILASS
jgi:hypothetical protein